MTKKDWFLEFDKMNSNTLKSEYEFLKEHYKKFKLKSSKLMLDYIIEYKNLVNNGERKEREERICS